LKVLNIRYTETLVRAAYVGNVLGRPGYAFMDVPTNLSECVCFLCVLEFGRYVPKASAFFVSVPAQIGGAVEGGYVYLVTAKHCVERAKRWGAMFVRLNTKSGGVYVQEIKSEWICLDEEGPDVAVLPFEPPADAEIRAVAIEMLATDEVIAQKRIGVGDDVVVTGLFTKRSGKARNIPILRAGMISAAPGEALTGSGGEEYQAYLIEMRSIGGLSGSPVFVVKRWFVDPNNKTPNLGLQRFSQVFFLIGLIRGHWEDEDIADIADDEDSGAKPFNMGIAVATPIQECLRILNGEELAKARRKADLEWSKKTVSTITNKTVS
jgi:hypothetical protein